MHTYMYILYQILFHYRLLQDAECSSLSYVVGPYCLPILYVIVCVYVNTKLLIYPLPPSFLFANH